MITNQKLHFNLPDGLTYLNCAYMSPLMKQVEKVGIQALSKKANPASIGPDDFFLDTDRLRVQFSKLIGAVESNRSVIIPSVSYGMANVMRNIHLDQGENIIVVGEQFPSNYYPWSRLCVEKKGELKVVSAQEGNQDRGRNWNERLLESINSKTKLVTLGHVHWADGTLFDLEAIRARTTDVGALLVIDGTQSIGALPFDIKKIKPDALVCAGYKWLMGPYSIGMAYYGPYFDSGVPVEENWINRLHSEDFAGLVSYEENYQPGALRYEVGEHSNFNLVPMLLKALEQINRWSPEEIQSYCAAISRDAIHELTTNGFAIESTDYRGSHLFGIRLPKHMQIDALKVRLSAANINVSVRGDAVRVSPHLYNTEDDFNRLTEELIK